MNRLSRIALASTAALVLATPVLAQTADTGTTIPPSQGAVSGRSGIIVKQEPGQALSSDLVGMTVMGRRGETVGEVSDLIVEDGRVVGAVLNVGGFLGLGAKEVGVPWSALTLSRIGGGAVAVVALDKDQLGSMPAFKTRAEVDAEQSLQPKPTTGSTGSATGSMGGGTTKQ